MDSRYPCHYLTDRRVQRLSDGAHRTFVTATAWCVDNRTDGEVPSEDLDLIPRATAEHMAELVKRELAVSTEDGWVLTEYGKTQTSAAQIEAALENRRASDRERKARARAKKKSQPDDPSPADPPVSRGQSADGHVTNGGEERRGEERRGEASFEGEVALNAEDDSDDFTSVPVPEVPSEDPGYVLGEEVSPGGPRRVYGTRSLWADEEDQRSYCRAGGCANRPLPGMEECAEHVPDREEFEAERARQMGELGQASGRWVA